MVNSFKPKALGAGVLGVPGSLRPRFQGALRPGGTWLTGEPGNPN
jgi:hypothetical protein